MANLNRQVFLYDSIGRGKDKTLAARINVKFEAGDVKFVAGSFDRQTGISGFDAVFAEVQRWGKFRNVT